MAKRNLNRALTTEQPEPCIRSPSYDHDKLAHGLYFLLCHLQYGLTFPRTIATKRLDGAQIAVDSFKEAMVKFDLADGLDC
jgi:hypothetical protein